MQLEDPSPLQQESTSVHEGQNEEIWANDQVDADILLQHLSQGRRQTVVYSGLDCKSCDNVSEGETTPSTCALTALNCARTMFGLDKEGVWLPTELREQRLLTNILNRDTLESVLSISGPLRGYCRLGITELLKVPLFKGAFGTSAFSPTKIPYPGTANVEGVINLLKSEAFNVEPTVAVIIAYHARNRDDLQRCSNIICMRVQNTSLYRYIIFHQSSKAEDTLQTSLTLSPTDEGTARHIAAVLQQVGVDSFDAYILTVGEPSSLFFNDDILHQTVSMLSSSAKQPSPTITETAESIHHPVLHVDSMTQQSGHPHSPSAVITHSPSGSVDHVPLSRDDSLQPSLSRNDPLQPVEEKALEIAPQSDGASPISSSHPSSPIPASSPVSPKSPKRTEFGWQLSLQAKAAVVSPKQVLRRGNDTQSPTKLRKESGETSPQRQRGDTVDARKTGARERKATRGNTGKDFSWLLPLQQVQLSPNGLRTQSPTSEDGTEIPLSGEGVQQKENFGADGKTSSNLAFLQTTAPKIYNDGQLELLFRKPQPKKSTTETKNNTFPLESQADKTLAASSTSSTHQQESSALAEHVSMGLHHATEEISSPISQPHDGDGQTPQPLTDLELSSPIEDSFDVIDEEAPAVAINGVETESPALDDDWLLPLSQEVTNSLNNDSPASGMLDLDWGLPESEEHLDTDLAYAAIVTETETETSLEDVVSPTEGAGVGADSDWLLPQSLPESTHTKLETAHREELEAKPSYNISTLLSQAPKVERESPNELESDFDIIPETSIPSNSNNPQVQHTQSPLSEKTSSQLAYNFPIHQHESPKQKSFDNNKESGVETSLPALKSIASPSRKSTAAHTTRAEKFQDYRWQLDLLSTSTQAPPRTEKSPSSSRSSQTYSAKRQTTWSPLQLRPELEHSVNINQSRSPRSTELEDTANIAESSHAATSRANRRNRESNYSPTRSARQYRAVRDDYAWQLALVSKSLAPSENYLKDRQAQKQRSQTRDTNQWLTALATEQINNSGQDDFEEAPFVQTSFECGVCFEITEFDDAARMPNCEHSFCRECLQGHVQSKVEENQYPILCPICSMDRRTTTPGYVDQVLIEQLDLSERTLEKFAELQIAAHSIQIECPECEETMMIAREDYLAQPIITCPLPNCHRRFCRACRVTLKGVSDKHACKVDEELDKLMKANGWRYCPGCKTPIQKESGCNHMTCRSPGCSTHFCYTCGDSIWNSTSPQSLSTLLSNHYRNCNQFDTTPRVQPAHPVGGIANRRNRDCTIQ